MQVLVILAQRSAYLRPQAPDNELRPVEKLGNLSNLWTVVRGLWMAWTREHVQRQLGRLMARPERDASKQAAVAVVMRFAPDAQVLLIRRSEHAGDPWSGHMAFPGGRRETEDRTLLHTAVRETREEVGIDLDATSQLAGQLDEVEAIARGRRVDLVIVPFVFILQSAEVEPTVSDEVDEALWAELEPLAAGRADTTRPYVFEGQPLELPAFRVGPHVVWGLTYRMLIMLFDVLRRAEPRARASALAPSAEAASRGPAAGNRAGSSAVQQNCRSVLPTPPAGPHECPTILSCLGAHRRGCESPVRWPLSDKVVCLLSADDIAARTKQLGGQITEMYRDWRLVLVCVLKGSFMFLADLCRHIDLPLRIEFLGVQSYGEGTESSGVVRIAQSHATGRRRGPPGGRGHR